MLKYPQMLWKSNAASGNILAVKYIMKLVSGISSCGRPTASNSLVTCIIPCPLAKITPAIQF